LNSGSPLRAAQAFELAANEAPDWGLAFLQWGIALQLYSPESPDVVRALEHAVQLTPGNARAHFHLAQAYLRISKQSAAVDNLERTLEARDDYPNARFLLGRTQLELKRYTDAEGTLKDVLQRFANHTGAMAALAELYEKRGRPLAAETMLLRIARAQPQVAYHFVRLARFYERVGEPDKAREARAHANVVDPRPNREMRPLRRSR
ncbi:MAG: tetratricopeptide repeat protein, partial [Myxococcota bacterium]